MTTETDDPPFEAFKDPGDCPQCGEEDAGLFWASCCGMYFCWDCYWRKHEKYQIT